MFDEKERRIYGPYWNGRKNEDGAKISVFADPLVLHRQWIIALKGEHDAVLQKIRPLCPSKEDEGREWVPDEMVTAAVSMQDVVDAVAAVFELHTFDKSTGEGCDEDYMLRLLGDYLNWCEQKKTKPSNSVNSSAPTEFGQTVICSPTPLTSA